MFSDNSFTKCSRAHVVMIPSPVTKLTCLPVECLLFCWLFCYWFKTASWGGCQTIILFNLTNDKLSIITSYLILCRPQHSRIASAVSDLVSPWCLQRWWSWACWFHIQRREGRPMTSGDHQFCPITKTNRGSSHFKLRCRKWTID